MTRSERPEGVCENLYYSEPTHRVTSNKFRAGLETLPKKTYKWSLNRQENIEHYLPTNCK